MNNHTDTVHHIGNITAIAVPLGSFWLHLPTILSVLLTVAGLGWYGVLFYDRFIGKKNRE